MRKPVLEANGDKLMATVKYGKGTVFALGDPWIYNEYVDGRRLPAEFENFKAAQDLSRWLLQTKSAATVERVDYGGAACLVYARIATEKHSFSANRAA